jgi:hypothetical protein
MRHGVGSRASFVRTLVVAGLVGLMLGAGLWMAGDATAAGFSNASLKGTYAFSGGGVALFAAPGQPSAGPVYTSAVGTTVYDGKGHLHGTVTVSRTPMNGVPTPGPHRAAGEKPNPVQMTCTSKTTGTYEISADGTGTETVTSEPAEKGGPCASLTRTGSLVLSSGGRVVDTIITGVTVPDTSQGVFASLVAESEATRQ